jgi:PPOX class probable F420-dependent enzyme
MPDRQSATESTYQHEAADGYFGPLASAKYMRLTTFKPDGIPVSTSVHGVVDGDRAYFRAWKQSDTAKRLRRTDEVQVTACTALGLAVGPPLDAVARRLPAEKANWVAGMLARKYPFRQRFLIPLVHRTRRLQMAHYELLSYEAAPDQDVGPEAPRVPDRPAGAGPASG